MQVEETELKSESLALLIEEMKKLEVDGWKKVKQIAYIQTDKKTKKRKTIYTATYQKEIK